MDEWMDGLEDELIEDTSSKNWPQAEMLVSCRLLGLSASSTANNDNNKSFIKKKKTQPQKETERAHL